MDICPLCIVKWEWFLEHPLDVYENTMSLLSLTQFLRFCMGISVLIWEDNLQSTKGVRRHPLPAITTVRTAEWKTKFLAIESKIEPQNPSQHKMAIKRKHLALALLRTTSNIYWFVFIVYYSSIFLKLLFYFQRMKAYDFIPQINIFHYSLTSYK